MNNDIFKEKLKLAELNKTTFAELVGTSGQAVNNWNTNGREIPYWVESWLNLYIENKKCKKLKQLIKDAGVCN
ncbi:conserved hypothetical protein [Arcobacter nitrofigilis DSM 7299]|uniref:HTH cro/C1-type domain-containing protein n=1 Tax=Arcobacter nitrofigilis (strain ATCC 33309 / DSM 7299 / CCUG 15893 / LMG 7604 / NCTC 12251 / CI) TaxID=572480 RepID=D5V259_ARCNC|nr:hypothetical protein [Arcobacter nitrofigilis]ADG92292.1 conserved hypothetical protein [Arcobacter nitrofigilis DSM 7299]